VTTTLRDLSRRHLPLIVILVVFFALGLLYDSSTPLFEGLDELWHYALVEHLADGGGLPVQVPGENPPWRQEGSQPPLYYLLAAGATAWIDTGDYWSHRAMPSHNLTTGDPHASGDKFYFYHTRRQDFPYRRTALAVHAARWLSLVMAGATVTLTYAAAREVFPDQPAIPPLAAAIVAFNPEFLFIAAQVNNDNLANLLGAGVGFLMIRLWTRGDSIGVAVGLGLVSGLMALTKLNGLVVLAVIPLVVGVWAVPRRAWQSLALIGLACVTGFVMIAGWWYVRNVALYGNAFALGVMDSFVGSRSLTFWQALSEYEGLHFSYWGLFGIANILAPLSFFRVYAAFSLAALPGLGVVLWRSRAEWQALRPPALIVPLAHAALVVIGMVVWSAHSNGPMARLAFPAAGSISLLAAAGLLALLPRRWHHLTAALLAGGMAILALAVPPTSILPMYRDAMYRPPLAAGGVDMQHPFEATVVDIAALRGYDLALTDGALEITFHWEPLTPATDDLIVMVHILEADGNRAAGLDSPPQSGAYPTTVWSPGEWIADTHIVPLPPDLPPGEYWIGTGMYRASDLASRAAVDAAGSPYPGNVIVLPGPITLPS
jgi:4-amino-4-deoxy-L-arabinose transferase-like glycosyltransferase